MSPSGRLFRRFAAAILLGLRIVLSELRAGLSAALVLSDWMYLRLLEADE